jgi:AcrR family transcriptional regulator
VESVSNEIQVGYADRKINALLEQVGAGTGAFTRHFSQGEEFFLRLDQEFTVPALPIHHDVRRAEPSAGYIEALRSLLAQVAARAPQVLRDLSYFFDPAEILRPCFFKLFRLEESFYLYLLRMDLALKPSEGTIMERGTNDTTPRYSTRKLFLESVIIPLEEVVRDDGKVKSFRIRQTISQTWIGEQGRGYFVQGIWMDADLTKFFSRLFLPSGMKSYPFYPYLCKYKTVCQAIINPAPEGRKATIPYLHRALQFLVPVMDRIQSVMKSASFSEDLGFFRELKAKVPASWYEAWKNVRLESYLNEAERREFRVED